FLISYCTYPRIKISLKIFKINFHKNKFEIFNPKIYIEYGMRFMLKITRFSCDRSVRTSSTSVLEDNKEMDTVGTFIHGKT
ncbi:hypothetical protein ACQWF4_23265, partial [Salmonella enterica subsp. enterica serovar Infantis]